MQITAEILEANLAKFRQERDSHIAEATALGGAIQVVEQMLEHVKHPEPEPTQPATEESSSA